MRRTALAALVAALLAALSACSAPAQQAPADPSPVPPAGPASSARPSPTATSLLSSEPATLEAFRARERRAPVRLAVPGHDPAPVRVFTTDPVSGGLSLPADATTVAWWGSGATPGDATGTVVLAAHVSYRGQTGPFTALRDVDPGVVVRLDSQDGSQRRYVVTSVRHAAKDALDRAALFTTAGPPRIVLVTCGGAYDRRTRSFEENVVVVAEPR